MVQQNAELLCFIVLRSQQLLQLQIWVLKPRAIRRADACSCRHSFKCSYCSSYYECWVVNAPAIPRMFFMGASRIFISIQEYKLAMGLLWFPIQIIKNWLLRCDPVGARAHKLIIVSMCLFLLLIWEDLLPFASAFFSWSTDNDFQ